MITTDRWESQADIKRRTGLRLDEVNRILRDEMRDKKCQCRLDGDETLMIPFFRANQPTE